MKKAELEDRVKQLEKKLLDMKSNAEILKGKVKHNGDLANKYKGMYEQSEKQYQDQMAARIKKQDEVWDLRGKFTEAESRIEWLELQLAKKKTVEAKIAYMLSTDFLILVRSVSDAGIESLTRLVEMAVIPTVEGE